MYVSVSLVFLHKVTNFNINIHNAVTIFVANTLGVTGVYLLNKITDEEEDLHNGHTTSALNTKLILVYLSLIFILATTLYGLPQKENLKLYGFILFAGGTLYSFPKKYRLKNIFLLKNIIPAFCWYFSLCVLIFASTKTLPMLFIMQVLIPLFILEFIFEIIWDLPDTRGDSLAGIQTLPVVIGFQYTQIFLATLISGYFFYTDSVPNKLFCLFIFIFILLVKKEMKKYIYHYFLFALTISVSVIYFISLS
jgi:4-hydroxybenzoate polyprenyltransferase